LPVGKVLLVPQILIRRHQEIVALVFRHIE